MNNSLYLLNAIVDNIPWENLIMSFKLLPLDIYEHFKETHF